MATLLEMKKKSTEEYIKVMQAWLAGKIILARPLNQWHMDWSHSKYPGWDFAHFEYKILEEEPVDNEGDVRNAA